MKPIIQEPADLKLAILRTELPVKLTALKQATASTGDWRFLFRIVGESHLARVEHCGKLVLQEVLACIDVGAAQCVERHDFRDLAAHRYEQNGYSVAVSFLDRAVWGMLPPHGHDRLEVEFPCIYGRSPLTRIQWEVAAHSVRWWTLHVYPQPQGITSVHSRSEFRLR